MSAEDNALWRQCWRDRQSGSFHLEAVNPLLVRRWPDLALARGSRVLVPLCGKSLDLMWLAEQGHEVVGIELSPIAVREFFREHRLKPSRRRDGGMVRWCHGRITILCGDFFELTASQLGAIDAIYDRAALTALPEVLRRKYAEHLASVVPAIAGILLLTAEDAEPGEAPEAVLAAAQEVIDLFAARFTVTLAHVESLIEPDSQSSDVSGHCVHYKAYLLSALP